MTAENINAATLNETLRELKEQNALLRKTNEDAVKAAKARRDAELSNEQKESS